MVSRSGRRATTTCRFWARSKSEPLLGSGGRRAGWVRDCRTAGRRGVRARYARLGFAVVPLDEYDAALRARRESDGRSGLLLASRVIMRASGHRVLE